MGVDVGRRIVGYRVGWHRGVGCSDRCSGPSNAGGSSGSSGPDIVRGGLNIVVRCGGGGARSAPRGSRLTRLRIRLIFIPAVHRIREGPFAGQHADKTG